MKRRDPFWGGYKEIIRRYKREKDTLTDAQMNAVQSAIDATNELDDGEDRMSLVDMIFWAGTHTLEGAALALNISERTARRWHTEFIRAVGENIGF